MQNPDPEIVRNKNSTCSVRLKFLKWDSDIFGFKIGRIEDILLGGGEDEGRRFLKRVVEGCRKAGYRHLICRVGLKDIRVLRALEGAGFNIADVQITLTTNGTPPKRKVAVSKRTKIRKATKRDLAQLKIITKDAFTDTRVVLDPGYPRERVDRFYYEWVRNSVYNRRQTVFVAEDKKTDRLTGFVICDFKDASGTKTGMIDLIAVDKYRRNSGVGSSLVGFALNWFSGRADRVEVRTQASNVPAIKVFMKNGLNEFTTGIALHSGISMHRWF